jgi:hypothetical protein
MPSLSNALSPGVPIEREVAEIEMALATAGPQTRTELFSRISASYWGPARFSRALRTALGRGRVRRVRNRYEYV